MKKVLFSTLLLTSLVANAKLTLFSEQDAARLVLEQDVMSKVLTKSKTATFSKLSVEKIETNQFEVTVETKLDKKFCESVLKIKDKKKTAILPGGGAITTNSLIVTKIEKATCL